MLAIQLHVGRLLWRILIYCKYNQHGCDGIIIFSRCCRVCRLIEPRPSISKFTSTEITKNNTFHRRNGRTLHQRNIMCCILSLQRGQTLLISTLLSCHIRRCCTKGSRFTFLEHYSNFYFTNSWESVKIMCQVLKKSRHLMLSLTILQSSCKLQWIDPDVILPRSIFRVA